MRLTSSRQAVRPKKSRNPAVNTATTSPVWPGLHRSAQQSQNTPKTTIGELGHPRRSATARPAAAKARASHSEVLSDQMASTAAPASI